MEQLVSKYLDSLTIPVSKKYCEKLIASHPDYPSLLSIADTLQRLGIRHKVAWKTKEGLADVESPYLFWPDEHSGEPKLIRGQEDLLPINGTLKTSNNSSDEQTIVLKAEPTDRIIDAENNRQLSEERFLKTLMLILVVGIIGLILWAFGSLLFSWTYSALLFTVFIGTLVGYLLIAKDVGISYEPVEEFCRAGRKINCDVVLNSEAARLFGERVTFSDVTASYFLFQLLVVSFLLPLDPSFIWILSILSVCTLPVVGFSLYYQAFSVKTWCRLCLLVDGILAIQAIFFGYMYSKQFMAVTDIRLQPYVLAGLLFLVTGSLVLLVKNKIKAANKAIQNAIVANRIKYVPEVFLYLLRRENRVDTTPFEQELLIGDPEAPVQLLMAASLGCGPCKKGFKQAVQLVNTWPGKVNMSIRLRTESRQNEEITPSIELLNYWKQHIYRKSEASAQTEKLFRDWFDKMDIKAFREEYPIAKNGQWDLVKSWMAKHNEWFKEQRIQKTPQFFVNGYQIPKNYNVNDMIVLVPHLG